MRSPSKVKAAPLKTLPEASPETFTRHGNLITRTITRRDGTEHQSSLEAGREDVKIEASKAFDAAWLRTRKAPPVPEGAPLKIVDLFAGCGGMSLGIQEAARAVGRATTFAFASEMEDQYLAVYRSNFRPTHHQSGELERTLTGHVGDRMSLDEKRLQKNLKDIAIVAAGPPCQGHSDLNNYTRRSDPKNSLYAKVARFAEIIAPENIIIENVPGVKHDTGRVMQRTMEALDKLGYHVDSANINANEIGVAQRRQRTFVIATKSHVSSVSNLASTVAQFRTSERPVAWAIEDLIHASGSSAFDDFSKLSEESKRRVDWMFDNDEYDLPDRFRPDCHRTKVHSYKSVYGRLYWDQPAWTITTGFQVMGQGRFIHPTERRGLTSHEAARLQFFPDFFDFGTQTRKSYAKMIGNAVPPKMAYVVGLHLLR